MASDTGSLSPKRRADTEQEGSRALHRIVVAIDLGEHSGKALARGCRIAAQRGASLRIIHAAPGPLDLSEQAALRVDIRKQVHQIAERLSDPEIDFSLHIPEGRPEEAIAQEAERIGADLVIVGGHGEPRFRDAIFGITASHVLQRLAVPLLVAQGENAGDYKRVMAASDDAAFAADLVRVASQIAPGADMHVVQAVNPRGLALFESDAAIAKRRHGREHALQQTLAAALASEPVAEHLFTSVEEGDPMAVIEHCSDRLRPDLIAMGTHGCMGMERLIQDSFAEYMLLWASFDVLIVPVGLPSDHPTGTRSEAA
ncbi:universal stress protein [Allosphingosinicella flava]|uniref:Universal stress protein n=1 Tax=Allosphingosinicella flava TaxID=2771430 RepID=A0A7T2GJF6_9SPHN|nr:universal stress protein [Sphingosinicella flava]QPQ54964.1 universal stress protein [Sphingosinicella flava]